MAVMVGKNGIAKEFTYRLLKPNFSDAVLPCTTNLHKKWSILSLLVKFERGMASSTVS